MSSEGPAPDTMGPLGDAADLPPGGSNGESANGVPPMPSETATVVPGSSATAAVRRAASWLGGTRLGLIVMALVVGAGAGLGAVAFRWLIYSFTWLVTGHHQFGQQGHAPSAHFHWLGIWFLLLAPVVGGLLYGPLIQRFAREARGHGVPEVMLAVAENGGRIRPPVTIVKALASAMCIGTGGSVGREGPIVQIGSAFASTLGQVVRMSETRLRIIVACGAAGGIAATFNAPITGLFFGFEIVLREFSLDAMFATILAAVTGDVVSRAFFGAAPFFTGMPHGLVVGSDYSYLLIAVLGLAAGLIGFGFKTFLYWLEDAVDDVWKGRPEWARPAVGGVALGVLLLVLPQMYGVGYPVMDKVVAGHVLLWFIVILMVGKIVAASLTLSIGGSGGVFAPSLFTGAMAGMAFGIAANRLFGSSIGAPAMYAVIAMGGVFGAAAQAPLTSIASVVEMTGNFTLTLPVMLATGIAAALSKRLTYGSIYTTKLLRRGIDIERPKAPGMLKTLTVEEVMQPLATTDAAARLEPAWLEPAPDGDKASDTKTASGFGDLVGPVTAVDQPQALFPDEDLEQALRQLVLFGRDGLPVLSHDGQQVRGWITGQDVLHALGERVAASPPEIERGALAAEFATDNPETQVHVPTMPLHGYRIVEVTIDPSSPARGRRVDAVELPAGAVLVAVSEDGSLVAPRGEIHLRAGDRMILLTAAPSEEGEDDVSESAASEVRDVPHPARGS
ncbi:MAG TPA: chloride channel protein [Solirubrobacteraceae bacterium]|nr:chloride channel protein [Solirubrobacteraceae bacterium]